MPSCPLLVLCTPALAERHSIDVKSFAAVFGYPVLVYYVYSFEDSSSESGARKRFRMEQLLLVVLTMRPTHAGSTPGNEPSQRKSK